MPLDVSLITKDTEQLLVNSLRAAIADTNNGIPPNTALSKQAVDNGLGPELASRLVEAFNTSKTLSVLKNTKGEKRAESFEIADRDVVLATLYAGGTTEKVASVVHQSPAGVNFNTRPAAPVEKSAAAVLSKKADSTKRMLFGIRDNAIIAGRGLLADITNARTEYRMCTKQAQERVASSLFEFVNAFKRADRSSLSPLKDIEERLSYQFGPMAKQAMDIAWNQLSEKQRAVEKRASSVPTTHVYPLNDPLYKLAEAYITSVRDAAELCADAMKFEKKASIVEAHFKRQVDAIAGKIGGKADIVSTPGYSVLSKQADILVPDDGGEETEEDAGYDGEEDDGTVSPIKGYDLGLPSVLSLPKPVVAQPRSVFPAAHEAQLRAIKTKIMINDFISNDPVISGYPVNKVVTAFNQIASEFPALSTQPIAMRGILASMLQREGGFEAMEIQSLLDTEEAKRRLRVLGT